MAILRYAQQNNTTGGVLTSALITSGEDYTLKVIRRTLAAADVGNAAGQTVDNTNPAVGCLMAQFSGAVIKDVISLCLFRPAVYKAHVTTFNFTEYATDANFYSVGWRISPDGSSLYIADNGDNVATQLIAGDVIIAVVVLGNV